MHKLWVCSLVSSHKGEREAEEQASQKCFSPLLQSLVLPWETSLTAQGGVLWDLWEGGCAGRALRRRGDYKHLQTQDSEIRAHRLILWCFSHFQGWVSSLIFVVDGLLCIVQCIGQSHIVPLPSYTDVLVTWYTHFCWEYVSKWKFSVAGCA